MPDEPRLGAVTNIFNAPVGAVQTGAGSHAAVQMGLSASDVERLVPPLESLITAVRATTSLASVTRAEIQEAAQAAVEEARQARPNRIKLGGAVLALVSIVSGVADLAPAIENLRAAAVAVGLLRP